MCVCACSLFSLASESIFSVTKKTIAHDSLVTSSMFLCVTSWEDHGFSTNIWL